MAWPHDFIDSEHSPNSEENSMAQFDVPFVRSQFAQTSRRDTGGSNPSQFSSGFPRLSFTRPGQRCKASITGSAPIFLPFTHRSCLVSHYDPGSARNRRGSRRGLPPRCLFCGRLADSE